MRSLLQFLGIWGANIALTVGTLLIAAWALSFDDDPNHEKAASSLFWSVFWPLVWLYRWLTGKNTAPIGRRATHSSALTAGSQAGVQEQNARRFRTIREAKEYLAGAITEEAERNAAPLTEVERKMLYFTETGWTPPDMKEISSVFDRDYGQSKYDKR